MLLFALYLQNVIIRLGGFHLLMSFLRSICYPMNAVVGFFLRGISSPLTFKVSVFLFREAPGKRPTNSGWIWPTMNSISRIENWIKKVKFVVLKFYWNFYRFSESCSARLPGSNVTHGFVKKLIYFNIGAFLRIWPKILLVNLRFVYGDPKNL